jgi:hypothetical protein
MAMSRLLSLPKELRLLILEHLFNDDTPITIGRPSRMPWHGSPQPYNPPIFNVCRSLREEALPLCYKDRRVVLLLRFCEGRAQVRQWIENELTLPAISRGIKELSIQLFEVPHRTTAILLDCKTLSVINRESFVHPLTGQTLRILRDIDLLLSEIKTCDLEAHDAVQAMVSRVVEEFTAAIQESRVMRRECMANLQLQGYTDFQLRFEVISMLYHGSGDEPPRN